MPAISVNIITKNQPEPTLRAIESVFESLYQEGDEILVVDTGSSTEKLAELKELIGTLPGVRILEHPELSVPLRPYIEAWLPERLDEIEKDGQYFDGTGILDFSAAREVARKASKNEVIFWLDTDDVIFDQTQGKLREMLDEGMDPKDPKTDALFMDYQYAFDEDGQLTTTLKRERAFFRDRYHWVGRCHETAIPQPGVTDLRSVSYFEGMPAAIVHTEARKPGNISDIRNYIILRNELESLEEGEIPDPRTIYYLGNAARGLRRHKEAINLYTTFDGQSGSADDRWSMAYSVARIYMDPSIQRPLDASDWFSKCIEIAPGDPRGYFGMSRAYLALSRWQECIHWYKIGCTLPEPTESVHSYDPTHVHYHPHLVAASAAKELELTDFAADCAAKAAKFRPNFADAQRLNKLFDVYDASNELSRAVAFVGRHTRNPAELKKLVQEIIKYFEVVPPQLEKQGFGKIEVIDPRKKRPEVAILCGETLESWGPDNRQSGIGGSEKMVLLIAPKLQELGYNVSVYANVPFPQRGVGEDGVRWAHWAEFNETKRRHAIIAWRNHGLVYLKVPAEKRILWLHDVQNPKNYTDAPLKHVVDQIQFQSEYHLHDVKDVAPPDKVWIARNAIDEEMIKAALEKKEPRDPKKIVFLSSPDRGVASALWILKAAQILDPKLHMTVMYGFTPFYRKCVARQTHRHIPDLGRDGSMDDYERMIWRLVDETNTTVLHRVGFQRVIDELVTAGIWLYPTRFPEISCMAAMETQACGVVPVATDYGALAETILPEARELSAALPPLVGPISDQYTADAARLLVAAGEVAADDPRRQVMIDAALGKYGVAPLAKEWAERIGGLPEVADQDAP
jgi:glycosyltransferase involved in cell wall biosynthesis